MFPEAQLNPSATGDYWLYIPDEVNGNVVVRSTNQLSIVNAQGTLNITPGTDTSNLLTGLMMVQDLTTLGVHSSGNTNRYLSPYSNQMLMPKEIAIADGLSYIDVTSNTWSNQELVLGHLQNTIKAMKKNKKVTTNYQY